MGEVLPIPYCFSKFIGVNDLILPRYSQVSSSAYISFSRYICHPRTLSYTLIVHFALIVSLSSNEQILLLAGSSNSILLAPGHFPDVYIIFESFCGMGCSQTEIFFKLRFLFPKKKSTFHLMGHTKDMMLILYHFYINI